MSENENKTVEDNKEEQSLPKKKVIAFVIILWVGLLMCIFSWVKDFNVFGLFSSRLIGVAGGIIALAAIFGSRFAFKCPYCGGKKIGYGVGATVKKEIECPDCKKKVKIK